MNLGLAEARGTYVARLDADDMMYPTRLEKQVACLDAHPEVALVGSQVDWAGHAGTTHWRTPIEPHHARWTLLVENCFMHGGVTFRTGAVRALGGYDKTFATAEDYDLWLRLAEHHDVVNLPETLAWFNHLRDDNISTAQFERQEDTAMHLSARAIRRYIPNPTDAAVRDLYYVGRGRVWPDAPEGAERIRRLTDVSHLLVRLYAAFLVERGVPTAARAALCADRDRRLMRVRTAFVAGGGIGHLARLYRPRWDRRAWLLQLLALLSRS